MAESTIETVRRQAAIIENQAATISVQTNAMTSLREEIARLRSRHSNADDEQVVISRGVYDRLRDLVISFARKPAR
jgi:hypothetical protein